VTCTPLQRAIEASYTLLLPKGGHPFAYLSLDLDPATVDCNVHPTKAEVKFLEEEDIIEAIVLELGRVLETTNQSRTFKVPTLSTQLGKPGPSTQKKSSKPRVSSDDDDAMAVDEPAPSAPAKLAPQKLVRVDPKTRTLDGLLGFSATPSGSGRKLGQTSSSSLGKKRRQSSGVDEGAAIELSSDNEVEGMMTVARRIEMSRCKLTSVNALRSELAKSKHRGLDEIVHGHTFVGLVGADSPLALLQYSTKLYMVNYPALAGELFYQLALKQFGAMSRIKLDPPPVLRDLVRLAVSCEPSAVASPLGFDGVVDAVTARLFDSRAMLTEYFAMDITEAGVLESLPLLLPNYVPNLDRVPLCALASPGSI